MAMLKYGHAAVVTPIVAPHKWIDKKVPATRVASTQVVLGKYDPAQWLLSHVSIIASVDVDLADPNDPKSNYLIKPAHSIFVNNNGDSWERNLLKKCYRTFLGADNFVEHVQIPQLSKGKVIDVALREVPFAKDVEGNDITTLYVDILIATNRKHADLIDKIKTGEYNATSMGCLIKYSQCSQCGNIAEDDSQACKHVRYFKNNFFYDTNGERRIIAELCGRAEDPESCKFIDASWVRKPAFEGAVLRNIVSPDEDVSEKIEKAILMPSFERKPEMYLKAASVAADELVNEIQSQDEPASPPKDDTNFPEAPKDEKPLEVDTPDEEKPEEPAAETPAEPEVPATPVDTPPAGGDSLEPQPQVDVPDEDATVKEVKDLVKKQLLNKIRKEILEEDAKEQMEGKATPSEERPTEIENFENESLVKEAGLKSLLAKTRMLGNDRLYNGILILSNLKNWNQFKRYGYNRDDVLGLLYYVDKESSSNPIGSDSVRALSKIRLASGDLKQFFTEVILETGRKPMAVEASKLASWARILSNFE